MVENFPGTYEVELFYVFDGLTHVQRLNFDAPTDMGTPSVFADWLVQCADTTTFALDEAVDSYVDMIKPFFSAAVEITSANLWKYTSGTYVRTFRSTYDIGVAGTNVGGALPASQSVLTLRTSLGGRMRLTWLETSHPPNLKMPASALSGAEQTLKDWLISGENWIWGRDNGYPVSAINFLTGQNEAVFKQRYR